MSIEQERRDFYAWLRTQFTDLASAKAFMWKWATEWGEDLPEPFSDSLMSCRSLAAHVSAVLENNDVKTAGLCTNYAASKYGYELYEAAWSRPLTPADIQN